MKLFDPAGRAAFLVLTVVFGATSSVSQALNDPPSLVAHLPNYGESSISDVRLRGSVQNTNYSITATKTASHIVFDIILRERSVQLRIMNEDFPDIDLMSIREGINRESESETLRFDVEYGELGGSYGSGNPKRLLIRFTAEGEISASYLENDNGRLVWHRLALVQTSPSVYSAAAQGGD